MLQFRQQLKKVRVLDTLINRYYITFLQFQIKGLKAGQGKRYMWAESRSHLVTMAFNASILLSDVGIIFQPLLIVGLRYLNGTLQKSDWQLPVNTIM